MSDKKNDEGAIAEVIFGPDVDPAAMEDFLNAAMRAGLEPRECACGRGFLSRTTDPLCPPCRVRASAAGQQ